MSKATPRDSAATNGSTPALQSFKAVVTPVYCVRNEEGEIVNEISGDQLQFVVYAPELDKLRERMDALIPQVQQAFAEQAR